MENVFNTNKLNKAKEIINDLCLNTDNKTNVKYIKKEKGLMEHNPNDKKVILMEDNRQIICD